jgi:homeobox protein cut-like
MADLDLTNLITNLDNTASEIVAYQRDSTVQRKDLAQKTKDFRKLDDATKLAEIKGLLKGIAWSTMAPDGDRNES